MFYLNDEANFPHFKSCKIGNIICLSIIYGNTKGRILTKLSSQSTRINPRILLVSMPYKNELSIYPYPFCRHCKLFPRCKRSQYIGSHFKHDCCDAFGIGVQFSCFR